MALTLLDWLLIAAHFVFFFGIALFYHRRAGKDTAEFFLSGRNMPWWLAGTSMVATTFAADTPLAVTELVAQSGIAGNWLWWTFAFGGMLTVFFFARLRRRSGVLTDVEFVEQHRRRTRLFDPLRCGLLSQVPDAADGNLPCRCGRVGRIPVVGHRTTGTCSDLRSGLVSMKYASGTGSTGVKQATCSKWVNS